MGLQVSEFKCDERIHSYACIGADTCLTQRRGHHIGYEQARRVPPNPNIEKQQDPILLLNGFGVGSFHQHRLIRNVFESENESRMVYGVDYLGQGRSWPVDCDDGNSENEAGLIYSADVWLDQVVNFINDVILPQYDNQDRTTRIHLVGNSVGGYLAGFLAARRPELVASLTLLNPTPVWGLNLPFWSGHLPPPAIPRRVGRFLFDRIRDLNTIEMYLENAYANRKAFDAELVCTIIDARVFSRGNVVLIMSRSLTATFYIQMNQIRGCTEGKGGHAAFASILWSPPATYPSKDFQDTLLQLQCDVLLVFGKDDPWCKPAFGKKMLQALSERNNQYVSRYVELENVGHCPNHEAPQAVAKVVSAWVNASDRRKDSLTLVDESSKVTAEEWAEIVMHEKEASEIPLSLLDRIATTFV